MVTGIECAGIVLAIFPLVIEGIQLYYQGMQKIRGAREYASILYQYGSALGMEQVKFNQTWTRIIKLSNLQLRGIATRTPINFAELAHKDPGSAGVDLHTILRSSLSNCTTEDRERFEAGVRKLSVKLAEVQRDFKIVVDSIPDKHSVKKLVKMLKAELNSTYRDHTVSDIRNSNTDLDRIVDGEYQMQFYEMQAQLVAAQSKTRVGGHGFVDETSITQTGLYNLIKEQATQVHRVLQHTLQSGTCCNTPHSAGLELEFRTAKNSCNEGARTSNDFANKLWRFRLFFSFDYPVQQPPQNEICDLECEMMGKPGCNVNSGYGQGSAVTQSPILPALTMNAALAPATVTIINPPSPITNACQAEAPEMSPTPRRKAAAIRRRLGWASLDMLRERGERKRPPSVQHEPTKPPGHEHGPHNSTSYILSTQTTIATSHEPEPSNNPSAGSLQLQISAEEIAAPQITVSGHSSIESPESTTLAPQTIHMVAPSHDQPRCTKCHQTNNNVLARLCSTIKYSATQCHSTQVTCIGVLTCTSSSGAIRVCPRNGIVPGSSLRCRDIVSLRTMLGREGGTKTKKPPMVFRLRLGVVLASSVLQLHQSNWLNDRWTSADILFENGRDQAGCAVIQRPFVQRKFHAQKPEEASAPPDASYEWSSFTTFCNPLLFSLGIVLCEIYHWECIEVLQGGLSKSQAVSKLLNELFDVAGAKYDLAVRRCIQGLDRRGMAFSDDGFKKDVYEKIVHPLEENLATFYGVKEVHKIFEDEM